MIKMLNKQKSLRFLQGLGIITDMIKWKQFMEDLTAINQLS